MGIGELFSVGQLSGFVRNFNIGIYSDTVNVINVKLCMMILLIELYLFTPFSMTLTIFQHHSSVEHVPLTENVVFSSELAGFL